jgi:hypothetical protein
MQIQSEGGSSLFCCEPQLGYVIHVVAVLHGFESITWMDAIVSLWQDACLGVCRSGIAMSHMTIWLHTRQIRTG